MAKTDPATAAPAHDRTPDNTPLPGGGAWAWDDITGRWLDLHAPAEPANTATEPTQEP